MTPLFYITLYNSFSWRKPTDPEKQCIFDKPNIVNWTTTEHCQITHHHGHSTGNYQFNLKSLSIE